MNISDLSPSQLRQAATLKERIAKLQKELNSILGASTPVSAVAAAPKKRTMSATARALISAAQKARWAAKGDQDCQSRSCPQACEQSRCGDHARTQEEVETQCGRFGANQGRQQSLLGNEEGGEEVA